MKWDWLYFEEIFFQLWFCTIDEEEIWLFHSSALSRVYNIVVTVHSVRLNELTSLDLSISREQWERVHTFHALRLATVLQMLGGALL